MATGSNDPATLQPGHMFGYPVDSGTGCFMDHSAGQVLFAKMNAEPDYFKFMMAEMDKTYRHTWSWLNLPMGDANVIAFSSGDGDGLYGTYAGLNAEQQVVAVVTEFEVVPKLRWNAPMEGRILEPAAKLNYELSHASAPPVRRPSRRPVEAVSALRPAGA